MKATTLPTLPTCYYVDCRAMAMYLVWASEIRCAAHGGVRHCRANQCSVVNRVQKSKLFQLPIFNLFSFFLRTQNIFLSCARIDHQFFLLKMANLQYSPVEGRGTGGTPELGGSENRTDRNLNNLLLQAPLDFKSYQWRRVQLNKYETAPNLNHISQNLTSDCLLI